METTYRSGETVCRRVFFNDRKGRVRHEVICDGKGAPIGSILYGYDMESDECTEEKQFNQDGKLVRRLFYPGSLKDPKYARRFVAFPYDPDVSSGQILALAV